MLMFARGGAQCWVRSDEALASAPERERRPAGRLWGSARLTLGSRGRTFSDRLVFQPGVNKTAQARFRRCTACTLPAQTY